MPAATPSPASAGAGSRRTGSEQPPDGIGTGADCHANLPLGTRRFTGGRAVHEQVLPLVAAIERIVAVKGSGNVYSFGHLKKAAPRATCVCGWDAFSLPAYVSGSDGVVAGSAAVMPDREVELHRLVGAGAWDAARHLFYQRMLPMIAYTPDPYAFSVCKHLLHWKGIFDSPRVRPPYLDAPEWLQRELRELADQLGLLDGA